MRAITIAGAIAVTLALALGSGCSLFNRDYPSDACGSNADCFRAMGEQCIEGICQIPPPPSDAMPRPDARRPPDAGPDAAPPPDASTTDASPPDGGML